MTKVLGYRNIPEAIIVAAFIAVLLSMLFGSGCSLDEEPEQEFTPAELHPPDVDGGLELWTPVGPGPYAAGVVGDGNPVIVD